jgi:hypothetical protein
MMIPLLILASFCDQSHLCRARLYMNLARIVDEFAFRNFMYQPEGWEKIVHQTSYELRAASNSELNAGVNEMLGYN